jgi:hypothetical protein
MITLQQLTAHAETKPPLFLQDVLADFDVKALSELEPCQYPAFYECLEAEA